MATPSRSRTPWKSRARTLNGERLQSLEADPFEPQLATLGNAAPVGDGWLHERKFDGFRLLSITTARSARMYSRNAIEWTPKVPALARAVESLGVMSLALDGEMIAGQGRQQDFNALQASLSDKDDANRVYAVFDILHLDGVDLRGVALLERKQLLQDLLASAHERLHYSEHEIGHGEVAFKRAAKAGFEGIISKRVDAPYQSGLSRDWLKTKVVETEEFAVVGYTEGAGKRAGEVGSLLVATPDGHGGWSYAGRVGTGFTAQTLSAIRKKIARAGRSEPVVDVPAIARSAVRNARWFAPRFVVELELRGRGSSGIVRQASLKSIRDDKSVNDLMDSDCGSRRTKRG